MLSYTPANRNYDGKFRKIKVALATKGYHLAYRRGYFADDLSAPQKQEKDALSHDIGAAACSMARRSLIRSCSRLG